MEGMTDSIIKYYYVDEAGDGTIFDAKGRVIIGNEGCSKLPQNERIVVVPVLRAEFFEKFIRTNNFYSLKNFQIF
jgi:hypothetical protein